MQFKPNISPPPGVRFCVAGPPDRVRVQSFQAALYRQEFGHVPQDRFDDNASILCALTMNDDLVAALRVVLPEQRPFEFEDSVNLEDVLGATCRPALIGRFCVRPDYRVASKSLPLHAYLMKLTYLFARRNAVTDLILYTYEHLALYYRGLFFRHLGVKIVHPSWGDIMLMGLNIRAFYSHYHRSRNTMAQIILSDDLANIEF